MTEDREPQEEAGRGAVLPDEELVPEDDAVIGHAFRWSLVVLGGVAVLVAATWLVAVLWTGPEGVERPIEVAPPRLVEREVEPPRMSFADITRQAGIGFVHFDGAYGDKLLPETMGGGVAFLDYDGDGLPDLLFVNGTVWPHRPWTGPEPTMALYRNLGDGRFEDVTEEAGLDISHYGMGVAVGDINNNGWVDVLITGVGGNRLLENRGGRFVEVTERAGVGGSAEDWTTCAAFVDIDNNGLLDLFVCRYVEWSREIDFEVDYRLAGVGRAYGPPMNYEGTFPALYRNNGDGTFTDISEEAGIQVRNPATGLPMAKALGVLPKDVDGNGRIDLFVANDTVANFFFRNNGDGTFTEEALFYGVAFGPDGTATGAMGIDAGHVRNDREIAFLIGNFAHEMTSFYVSQGDPTIYADEAIVEGVGAPTRLALSFGLVVADMDLDGRLDIVQANGHIEDEIHIVDASQTYEQPAQLFWNAGPEQARPFHLLSDDHVGDLSRPMVGRGLAYADIDGDGDLDLVLTQIAGPPMLLRNDQELGHHWLRARLIGTRSNRDAIGARLELTAGGETQRRQVMPTRSYLSQVELPVTFGLGGSDRAERLDIVWPDGSRQRIVEPPTDRQLVVVERD